jgi:hypothetical protein
VSPSAVHALQRFLRLFCSEEAGTALMIQLTNATPAAWFGTRCTKSKKKAPGLLPGASVDQIRNV